MNDNSKCFLRKNDESYEEITYKELEKRRREIPEYNEKKFIYIHKMLMEVTPKDYEDYYYEVEKNRYAKKIFKKLCSISLDEFEEDDKIDCIQDKKSNVEEYVVNKLVQENLEELLNILPEEEYQIIDNLFYKKMSFREYSEKCNIPRSTLFDKKEQIIKKLKKFLKN